MCSICFSFLILVVIKKRETSCKNNPDIEGVKIPKSMSAKCLNVGSLSGLQNGESFCLQ
jgi:hypothetical protein